MRGGDEPARDEWHNWGRRHGPRNRQQAVRLREASRISSKTLTTAAPVMTGAARGCPTGFRLGGDGRVANDGGSVVMVFGPGDTRLGPDHERIVKGAFKLGQIKPHASCLGELFQLSYRSFQRSRRTVSRERSLVALFRTGPAWRA
ncbi:hypothetical protein EVAR_89896_1 [Eumeta japonica]|uniref:Uncharacterized protein n=1 Tax=Eumeta variegata TaxID=151549 RepID=A0A4C1YWD1_EUMVA|nr:hypothetical protein EVAR_89896_1 [Eumeta japonica]